MLKAKLPKEVTSYDLVKTFAVLIMIVDHIGFYFYPEALWWRVAGRMCVPVWMFLIGYAKSRDISFGLWNAALLLVVADVIVGWPVLPPNILFTVIVIRLFLDIVAGWFEKSEAMRSAVVAGMVALFVPTIIIFDYGTSAFALALFGYYVRLCQEGRCTLSFMRGVMAFAGIFFVLSQQICFGFNEVQFGVLAAGLLVVFLMMQNFSAREFPELGAKIGFAGRGFLQLCGRHSLEIYVAHLIIFKFTVLFLGLGETGWFAFKLLPPDL